MRNRYVVLVFIIFLFSACGNSSKQKQTDTSVTVENPQTVSEAKFPFPAIPTMLTQPEERKAYLMAHYWDNFNFADTALVNNRNVAEQGAADYLAILADGTLTEEQVKGSLDGFCKGMEAQEHARKVFLQMMEDYLYNPNSPFHNEGLYALFLERMLKSEFVDEARKSSLKFSLDLISRNCPGKVATDFVYFLPDGSRHSLAQTRAKNNRLLLVFYDPECPSCHETMQEMVADGMLAEAVKAGKLTVLAVYTEGNQEVWKRTLVDLPQGWTVGSDHETVKQGALYDLKAMPSLYLMDGTKRVLLKDAPYAKIREEIAAL
ncbi:MAG: DUF5106 domain-containing protein [Phocaeicola plebeius]|uniref:DUF5106 domain-containing protein n=1 Tax=Phocaeicola plebeius TaxID=310297 RepID=UPI0026E9C276|nr:DUF5106 domain-containing protein [Phocaeicola plebeius]MCI6049202.1 DUF5106 domain-containing protein [Phocaeicola plebeius]MDD6912881.1 DUF5106 domain-containing protein [Phocaeicola plebeius]